MDQRLDDLDPELARALELLERRATASADTIDAGRVAANVLARLRQPEVVAVPLWRRPALRVAAAIAVLVIGAVVATIAVRPSPGEFAAALPVAAEGSLDSLEASAAESLLAAVDQVQVEAASGPGAPTLEDLTESELLALLQAMESTEGTDL